MVHPVKGVAIEGISYISAVVEKPYFFLNPFAHGYNWRIIQEMTPRALAERICATLRRHGHQAYFVGGCVRDLELARAPADYDVCTDARPERVQELFPRSLAVGAKFGVILVLEDETQDAAQVEVATFRSDIGYSDGRHPDQVVYSDTPQEDVLRRDFTINGLLMDPATGEVLDFVGGLADLRAGIVRAIGDPRVRFTEDKLRMMRAVRFAARFGFQIEAETMAAAQKPRASNHAGFRRTHSR